MPVHRGPVGYRGTASVVPPRPADAGNVEQAPPSAAYGSPPPPPEPEPHLSDRERMGGYAKGGEAVVVEPPEAAPPVVRPHWGPDGKAVF